MYASVCVCVCVCICVCVLFYDCVETDFVDLRRVFMYVRRVLAINWHSSHTAKVTASLNIIPWAVTWVLMCCVAAMPVNTIVMRVVSIPFFFSFSPFILYLCVDRFLQLKKLFNMAFDVIIL